jgi:hypothetical protein
MDLLDDKSDLELSQSMIAEMAKAQNEINCARRDLEKANSRISFVLALQHKMINRTKDQKK